MILKILNDFLFFKNDFYNFFKIFQFYLDDFLNLFNDFKF